MTPFSNYVSVLDLCIRNDGIKREMLVILHAYFDETGDPNDSKFFGLGGCLASLGAWYRFEEQWKEKILGKYNLDFFHMTDFDGYHRKYSKENGWTRERHEECLNSIIDIISSTMDSCIGVVTEIAVPRKFSQEDDPYYDCFERLITMLKLTHQFQEDDLIHIFVARKEKFVGKTEDVFDRFVQNNSFAREHFVALTIPASAEMTRKIMPFQAADVIAFELRRERERVQGDSGRDRRYPLRRLSEMMRNKIMIGVPGGDPI